MTAEQQDTEQQNAEQQDSDQQDDRPRSKKPEIKDEHREEAKEMAKAYTEERPTVAMPDTGGTVSGTAVSEWVEEDERNRQVEQMAGENDVEES
ncbi:hypothetical protein [Mycobacterium sp.]|uniref:hypothetical protein n=1 Tax=Mycobacterium sp. TaxID=1785 RepID=UPI002D738D8C|nr:hypothetical protein [Mycobacterium sp.]HZA10012.1 hypothetical protein [Mycobacterium sp.]